MRLPHGASIFLGRLLMKCCALQHQLRPPLNFGGDPMPSHHRRPCCFYEFDHCGCVQATKSCAAVHQVLAAVTQVGAEFLALHYPLKLIYIPSPTWANHNKIFPLAGIQIRNYRYYKPSTRGLDFEVSPHSSSPPVLLLAAY